MESATNTGSLAAPLPGRRPVSAVLRDYLALTKPRIIGLLLIRPRPLAMRASLS